MDVGVQGGRGNLLEKSQRLPDNASKVFLSHCTRNNIQRLKFRHKGSILRGQKNTHVEYAYKEASLGKTNKQTLEPFISVPSFCAGIQELHSVTV